MTHISVKVDGTTYEDDVEPRLLLVHYLRDRLGLTGTPIGCDTSNCGACTVESDGVSVRSCSVLAVQADGGEVTTVEGLARDGELTPLDSYEFTCTGVFTTRTPTDAYRGAGRPEARTPSNGSWMSSPSNSAWIPWSCGAGTGSGTRSSRTPRSRA